MSFDEHGNAILICQPDIHFDEEPPEDNTLPADSMAMLLHAVFELGKWTAKDKIREFAARSILQQEARSVRSFAKERKVSESLIHLRIREARSLISHTRGA